MIETIKAFFANPPVQIITGLLLCLIPLWLLVRGFFREIRRFRHLHSQDRIEKVRIPSEREYRGANDHCVYVIHTENEQDPDKIYVGVTKNFEHRAETHKTHLQRGTHSNKNLLMGFRSGAPLVMRRICTDMTKMEAYDRENELRPRWNISWNVRPGGLPGIHF